MAGTPQGNAIAYQALKAPEPLKVGDIYSNMIDGLIKRNDAQKAAQMKALQDQQKEVGEWYKTVKIDPFATTAGLTDASGKLFKNTADFVSDQYMKAQQDPKNRYVYMQRANNAMNDYKTIASALGSQDFIKKADEKQKAIATGEYYLDSDDEDQYKMLLGTMFETGRDPETGMLTWSVPQNLNAKQGDPAAKLSTGQIISRYTDLPQKNYLPSFEEDLQKNAKDFADSYSNNTDGNRTKEWKGYAKERGYQWFDSTFGSFNAQQIDPRLQQWSKSKLGKEIQTSDDYEAVKQSITDNLSSYVPTETATKTKDSALDIELDRQRLKNLKLAAAKTIKSMQDDNEPIEANTGQTVVKQYNSEGKYIGYSTMNASTVAIPGTQNTFSIIPFKGKDGKTYPKYFIGGLTKSGVIANKEVTDPVNTLKTYGKNTDAVRIIAEAKKNANSIKAIPYRGKLKIYNNANSDISREIDEIQIAPKAKANSKNAKKDFENQIYDGLIQQ